MDPFERLAQLAEDREHGASEITVQAVPALVQLADQAGDPVEAVAEAGAELIKAQPVMASLLHLVDDLLDKLASGVPMDALETQLLEARAEQVEGLARQGADRFEDADVVGTYSRSGTVVSAIRQAVRAGASFRVLISEARPGEEGVSVARELAEEGVPVTLTTDAVLASRLGDVDVFVTGADALCAEGVVNKVGSGVLFREANRVGTEAFVLAGQDKVLPASYRRSPDVSRTEPMGHALPEGVQGASPLFECFPLEEGQPVVTASQAWSWEEVQARVAYASLHPALMDRLA